jgi:hypothetical protein
MHVSEASMLPVKIVYVGTCRYGKLEIRTSTSFGLW